MWKVSTCRLVLRPEQDLMSEKNSEQTLEHSSNQKSRNHKTSKTSRPKIIMATRVRTSTDMVNGVIPVISILVVIATGPHQFSQVQSPLCQ